MAAILELKYFNSFWLKKLDTIVEVENTGAEVEGNVSNNATINITSSNNEIRVGQNVSWTGAPTPNPSVYKVISPTQFILSEPVTVADGVGLLFGPLTDFTYIPNAYADGPTDWFIEEARIRGGYNNTNVDLGVKAYIVEDNILQQHRQNSLIYSGVFNSRTGVNKTNEFSVGEDITRSLDPANGSIQKLYSEDTNLIVFQEFKVSQALIDKDAIYSAEGQPMTTSGAQVIGQIQAYAGNYGIGTNPESFAVYGFRKYFVDRNRNVVLRLSQDGISEISEYGMGDFFRDNLSEIGNDGFILGMWDMHNKEYVLSMQPVDGTFKTLTFDEDVAGWTSFFDFKPNWSGSLRNNFYTFKNGEIWKHYSPSNSGWGSFYGTTYDSSVEVIFNPDVSLVKTFKTINYEGSTGWETLSFYTDSDISVPISKASYTTTLADLELQLFTNSFKRKEDKYFANLINITPASNSEVVWGNSMTGVKGTTATVRMRYSNTSLQNSGTLFAVSSDYIDSSY
ncbi:MAG: hypothetical protein ACOVK2_01485 [Candidatus Fonsibacter sp.]